MYKVQIDNANGNVKKYYDVIKASFPCAKLDKPESQWLQKYICTGMPLNKIMESIIKFHELDINKNELILDFDDNTKDKTIRITIYDGYVE